MTIRLPDTFTSRSVRAAVALHEEQLDAFLATWDRFVAAGAALPQVDDPDYASADILRAHVLRWAGTYLQWVCDHLDLPDPGLPPAPERGTALDDPDAHAAQVRAAWRTALLPVRSDALASEVYPAPWGTPTGIFAMLEHAIVHPMAHRFQLEELLGQAGS